MIFCSLIITNNTKVYRQTLKFLNYELYKFLLNVNKSVHIYSLPRFLAKLI